VTSQSRYDLKTIASVNFGFMSAGLRTVENAIFKIHRLFLSQHSIVLRDMLDGTASPKVRSLRQETESRIGSYYWAPSIESKPIIQSYSSVIFN